MQDGALTVSSSSNRQATIKIKEMNGGIFALKIEIISTSKRYVERFERGFSKDCHSYTECSQDGGSKAPGSGNRYRSIILWGYPLFTMYDAFVRMHGRGAY